jgi:hypothetical protein
MSSVLMVRPGGDAAPMGRGNCRAAEALLVGNVAAFASKVFGQHFIVAHGVSGSG